MHPGEPPPPGRRPPRLFVDALKAGMPVIVVPWPVRTRAMRLQRE